jgi:hypothetical protein
LALPTRHFHPVEPLTVLVTLVDAVAIAASLAPPRHSDENTMRWKSSVGDLLDKSIG